MPILYCKEMLTMKKKITGALLLAGLLILGTDGIRAQVPQKISLNTAVTIALENNIDLKRTKNQVYNSEISLKQKKADFYPYISASTSASQRYGQSFDMTVAKLEDHDAQSVSAGLSANVNLFNGFQDVASYSKAQLDLRSEELTFERQQENISIETVSGFFQIILDNELIVIEEENLEAQRRQLQQIQAFYEAGNRSVADLLQAQSAIAQAEYRLIANQRNRAVHEQQLIETMGLLPDGNYEFELPTVDMFAIEELEFEFSQLYQRALGNRTDLESQRYSINAAGKQINIAQAGYWPSLSLSLSMQSNYSSLSMFTFSDQFFDINPNKSVGLSLSIPLFDQFRTKNNTEQARVMLETEKLTELKLKQQVAFEVKQSILDYESLYKQLIAATEQREYAEKALEAEEERYNVGSSTIIDLTQTRSQYVEAASNEATAKMNLTLQKLIVEYYTGDIDKGIASLVEMQ